MSAPRGTLESRRRTHAARRASLAGQLGLSEKVFATASERRFARTVEEGLDRVEAGLRDEVR
ncbi:MAG TPA: hypothetical protein VFQ96_02585, partial [Microbacteriaceae bacterium]|nr:hypothetical protein [Microbacteriaceae bacterium]